MTLHLSWRKWFWSPNHFTRRRKGLLGKPGTRDLMAPHRYGFKRDTLNKVTTHRTRRMKRTRHRPLESSSNRTPLKRQWKTYHRSSSSFKDYAFFSTPRVPKKVCLNIHLKSILGWYTGFSVDHACLWKVSCPLSAHHYSLKKGDCWFHLTQLQVVSCSLVCLLNVSGGLLTMLRTHFRALSSLTFIRGNGPPACWEYGVRQKNAITQL